MTCSQLSNESIIRQVASLSIENKMTVCPELDEIAKKYDMPFDEAFTFVEEIFAEAAAKHQLDPAILFWIYLQWVGGNMQRK